MDYKHSYAVADDDAREHFYISRIYHDRAFTVDWEAMTERYPGLPHKRRAPSPTLPCAFGPAAQDLRCKQDAGGTAAVQDLALSRLDRQQVAWLGSFVNELGSSSRGGPRDHAETAPPEESLPAESHASTTTLPQNETKWSTPSHAVSQAFVLPCPPLPDIIEIKTRESRREQIYRACPGCRKAKAKCSGQRPCSRCVKRKTIDECLADDVNALRAHQRAKSRRTQLTVPFKIVVGKHPSGFPLSWRDDCESLDEEQAAQSVGSMADVHDPQVSYAALLALGVRGVRQVTPTTGDKDRSPSCTAEQKAFEGHDHESAPVYSAVIRTFPGKLVAVTELDKRETN